MAVSSIVVMCWPPSLLLAVWRHSVIDIFKS